MKRGRPPVAEEPDKTEEFFGRVTLAGWLLLAVCGVVGFKGTLRFDTSKPDGMPRKLLDVSRLRALGWRHRTALRPGIESTYRWFLQHQGSLRGEGVAV